MIKQFICFHNKCHPSEMDADEVCAYLTYLATERKVSISTQHVALCALIFLYRVVLEQPLLGTLHFTQPRPQRRLGVVFTRAEVQAPSSHSSTSPIC